MASVYRKTPKGQSEIETRANRLTPRLRSSLILVDGRRSDDDLRAMISVDPDAVLATLAEQGYIEVIATAPPARSSAASPAAAPAASSSRSDSGERKFEEVQRMAVRFLNDQMGPSAESVALKIEKAHNWDELKPQLEMAEHFLRAGRGVAASREFAAKFIEQPPAA
jgi:hypothetical protein